jgi:nucleotidyltransferase substrate binding protein (TIGR01987 family)
MTDAKVSPELPELDIKPLERALGQFEIAVAAWDAAPQDALIRDAVIQRFEFTYELSMKMLRRYLRLVAISEDEVNDLTFRDLIRRASDLNLIKGDLGSWVAFRQARNDTVHTYNETRAIEVAGATTKFALEARTLLEALKEKIQP